MSKEIFQAHEIRDRIKIDYKYGLFLSKTSYYYESFF